MDGDGDGDADILGIGPGGVWVARASGGGFGPPFKASSELDVSALSVTYSKDKWPIKIGDFDGTKGPDLVFFADASVSAMVAGYSVPGTYVALNKGDGTFAAATLWTTDFAPAQYPTDSVYARHVADFNGDGLADLVGFRGDGVRIGLSAASTPAGYVGYVTRSAVFGQDEFVKTQTGPTSTRRGWLLDVVNVSVTPYTFSEPFVGDSAVLAKDNLKLEFQAHIVFSIDPTQVRTFAEKFSTLKEGGDQVEGAYQQFMRESFRTAVRDEIQKLEALAVKENIDGISRRLTAWAGEYVKGSPFAVKSVVVGNIQYPEVVSKAVADKMAATQTLEKKATEVAIAKAEAERLREEARGQADAAAIIQAKLSPLYVQNRAIDAMSGLAAKPSTTVIYLPVGPNGVPIVRQ